LCVEFGFSELAAKLSEFRPSMDFKETKTEDADAREQIAALEEKANQHTHVIAILQFEVRQLSTDFGRLVGEVSALRSAAAGIQTLSEEVFAQKRPIAQKLNDPVVEQPSTNLSELRKEVLTQKAQIAAMSLTVNPSQNQPPSPSPPSQRITSAPAQNQRPPPSPAVSQPITSTPSQKQALTPSPAALQPVHSVPNQPPSLSPVAAPPTAVASIHSRIISDFPEIFAEFRRKDFKILWRGSRDGFKANEFHRRCDGHANTLTVIFDTEGNIFGGFTPLEWESRTSNCVKADESLKSFLFTLKNPQNISARKFALKAKTKDEAIWCISNSGPVFTGGILVSDSCNVNTGSWTDLGDVYTNDTGMGGRIVFTGSKYFQVKEIEVFGITD
jgi:FtsZ-binding cell division protein ZapB